MRPTKLRELLLVYKVDVIVYKVIFEKDEYRTTVFGKRRRLYTSASKLNKFTRKYKEFFKEDVPARDQPK